jgi:hypothetical protein
MALEVQLGAADFAVPSILRSFVRGWPLLVVARKRLTGVLGFAAFFVFGPEAIEELRMSGDGSSDFVASLLVEVPTLFSETFGDLDRSLTISSDRSRTCFVVDNSGCFNASVTKIAFLSLSTEYIRRLLRCHRLRKQVDSV